MPQLSALVDVNMCAAAGPVSGAYLQATSQFPGKGPCYPVWAATAPFFNRCVFESESREGGEARSCHEPAPGQGAVTRSGPRRRLP